MKYIDLTTIQKKILLSGGNLLVKVDFDKTWTETLNGVTKTAVCCSYLALDEFNRDELFYRIDKNQNLNKLDSSVYSGYWEINYINSQINACTN